MAAENVETRETGEAGVRMVALWLLLTVAFFVLTKGRDER